MTLEPAKLPVASTPATAVESQYLASTQSGDWIAPPKDPNFDPWGEDQLKHMNVATWKEGSPVATHMVEPTPLPIENTPKVAAA